MAWVEIEDVTVIHETARGESNAGAVLISVETVAGVEEVWIPKAAISENSDVYELGQEGTLVISEKLATEKGLV